MSFDLYFCRKDGNNLDFSAIKAWAETYHPFEIGDAQLSYHNDATGVYFSLDFESPEQTDQGESPVPADIPYSGLSFNLNFIRPSFFAFEAMPIVADLANRFGLSILDPQRDGNSQPGEVNAQTLIESWQKSNRWAVSAYPDTGGSLPPRMRPDKSLFLWQYSTSKSELEGVCGENLFVPRLFPFRGKASSTAEISVVCGEGVWMVVPPCDWVIVMRKKKRAFRAPENETVAISRETFDVVTAEWLKPFEWRIPEFKLIPREAVERVAKALWAVERRLSKDEFETLPFDGFIDVEAEQT